MLNVILLTYWFYLFLGFILIFLTVCFISCKIQESSPHIVKKLRENQYRATVLLFPKRSKSPIEGDIKEVYLKIKEKRYFVKIDEGYVSKDEFLKYLNQEILIKGVIKNGLWEPQRPAAIMGAKQPKKARSGMYIAVEKIYKNKK